MRARWFVATLLFCLGGGCGFSAQPLDPLVVGAQQFFTLEWQAGTRAGQRIVEGYIQNRWGFTATNVRLLVEGVEAPGRIASQRVIWIGGQLMPGARAPFQVTMPPAPTYRVRVFAYDWAEAAESSGRP